MARQPFEIPVPVHGDEVCAAVPRAGGEEILQPGKSCGCTRDGRRTELDAHFLQWLDLSLPYLRRLLRVYSRAAVVGTVGFVEGEHVGDVRAGFYQARDVVQEGGIG